MSDADAAPGDGAPARAAAGQVVVCDVSAVTQPDLATVDMLARAQLYARRHGRTVVLRGCDRALRELLVLAGLDEVLVVEGGSVVQGHREPEQREQPRLEELGQLDDPPP